MQYEVVVVVDPKVEPKDAEQKFSALLVKEGFTVSGMNPWGKRKFAYPIKRHVEGLYFSMTIVSETSKPAGFLAKLKMDETILRSLVLRKEIKREKSKSQIQNPN